MSKRLKGIYQNSQPIDQPEGMYRDAVNCVVDEKRGAITDELGNVPKSILSPAGYTTLGTILLDNDHVVIFQSEEGENVNGRILLFDPENNTVDTLIENTILNITCLCKVQGDFYIDQYGDRYIVWVGGDNPIRFLNITNVPSNVTSESLSLFPSVTDAPKISLGSVNSSGGNLQAGAYYFAVALKHADQTLTNFYNVIGPVYISEREATNERSFSGSDFEELTGKSVTLNFENIDDSYESIQLAVIPKVGNVFGEVQLLPEISIETEQYTYSGNESFTPGSLAEIQIDGAYYDKGKTISINEDNIYVGNLEERKDIGYQKYANKIKILPESGHLQDGFNYTMLEPNEAVENVDDANIHDNENSYRSLENASKRKGFKRGEVYAFYISWILKEGGESKAYHIPGRAPKDLSTIAQGTIKFNTNLVSFGSPELVLHIQNQDTSYGSFTIPVNNNDTPEDLAFAIRDYFVNNPSASLNDDYFIDVFPPELGTVVFRSKETGEEWNGSISLGVTGGSAVDFTIKNLTGGQNYDEQTEPFEDSDLEGILNKKRFQFEQDGSPNEMAYWENENETYPDDDQWDSTDINGEDLRNQPVRHHHMPGILQHPLYQWSSLDNRYHYKPLGIRLENIEVPEELEGKVSGYKIYYAKRTDENKRILDQGTNIQSRVNNDILRANFGNGNINSKENVYYTHPFNFLRDRKSVSRISYIKAISRFRNFNNLMILSGSGNILPPGDMDTNTATTIYDHINSTNVIFQSDRYKTLRGAAYVNTINETSFTALSNFGISNPIDNNQGEGKLVIEINGMDYNDVSFMKFGDEVGEGKPHYLLEFYSFKRDMYLSFDQQELCDTGYFHTDLNNTDSDLVFGGDTFLNIYTFKTTSQPTSLPFVGLHNMIVESESNIAMRNSGQQVWEEFYPNVDYKYLSANWFRDGQPRYNSSDADITFRDNFYRYNDDYSALNNVKFPQINPKRNPRPQKYPTRIIRNVDQRTFLPDDFTDLSTKRGELVKLSVYNNILVPHMKRALVRTKGREELVTDEIRAFLGSGDIFSVKPDEVIYTEDGFGGLNNLSHSKSTPYGYYFYDKDVNTFFELTNDGLRDIGDSIRPVLREGQIDTLKIGYDPFYERILFTTDDETWSYDPKIKNWISRHSYHPEIYFNTKKDLYSIWKNPQNNIDRIYLHNKGNPLQFYGNRYDMEFEYVANENPQQSKKASAIYIIGDRFDSSGELRTNKLFDQFRIWNTNQANVEDLTQYEQLIYFADFPNNPYIGNIRKTLNKWFINQFRDQKNVPTGNDPSDRWKFQRRLEDHFHRVRLVRDGIDNDRIYLYATDVIHKPSIR